MPQELNFALGGGVPLSIANLLVNIAIGAFLSIILRWHFSRFGSTLSNREEFAQVFPFVLMTTILIISVVKSSLALSLGLVGALSIVRFRTPIKEPEELAYLFIAIAIGLGLGAAQTIPTVIASICILALMALFKWNRREEKGKNLYLSVDLHGQKSDQPDRYLEQLNDVITKHVITVDLRRYDVREASLDATYFIDIASVDNISALTDELRRVFPSIGVTFLDQNQLPSI